MTAVWEWIEESRQLVLDTPGRQLTIKWDDGDRGWFLSVIKPARPATMGQPATQPAVYICPLPLLAAMTLTPPSLHVHLVAKVREELEESRGAVNTSLGEVVGYLPQPWPGTVRAARAFGAAAERVADVERLSMDWVAAQAFG